MAEGDRDHPEALASGRWLRRSTAALVALVLILAGTSYWFDLGPRWFGVDVPDPVSEPAEVPAPEGLELPPMQAAEEVAAPSAAVGGAPAAVRRALAALIRDKRFGPRLAVDVTEVGKSRPLLADGPSTVTPASTMKLLTSTAALAALGPDHRFTTSVVTGRGRDIVLVGGGDPLLARAPDPDRYPKRADLTTLAKATATALRDAGRTRVRLGYDASLFTGPAVNPAWPSTYIGEFVVSPISALWVDEGRETDGFSLRVPDPAAAAAEVFRTALLKRGIKVEGAVRAARAPATAEELAAVEGGTVAQIVQHVLETSDNEAAEVLARHVALAERRPASFAGGSAAIADVLEGLGIDMAGNQIKDGSGLSRLSRVRPGTLTDVLQEASTGDGDLRTVVSGLPVAGFNGSLAYRFTTGDPAALGMVRAKTGTLTGVHGLAGTVTTEDGVVLTWVAVADRVKPVNTLPVRNLLDEIGAALAGCTCAAR